MANENTKAESQTRTDSEVLTRSWDQNFGIWLRNMRGTLFDLGNVVRSLAEQTCRENRRLEVLEITRGIPLKGLELRGASFRNRGDFLICGFQGPHPKTEIHTTVLSDRDRTKALLGNELSVSSRELRDLQTNFLQSALDCPEYDRSKSPEAANPILLKAYLDRLESGAIVFVEDSDPATALDNLFKQGKRFDLMFLDPETSADKRAFLKAVQRVLAVGGAAYLPVTWWYPNGGEGEGITETELWSEKITTDQGEENLEDYLVRRFPEAFAIAHFPGAKTLIIKGTATPIDTDNSPENPPQKNQCARGNLIVAEITEEESEGLIITWARPGYRRTLIASAGREGPLYTHLKRLFPDLSKAAGTGLAVWTDKDGFAESIGEINGEKVEVIK